MFLGYHRRLNILAGWKSSLWKLVETLHKESENFSENLKSIKLGYSSRVESKKHEATSKALNTAFDTFDASGDAKHLLRCASRQAEKLSLGMLESDDDGKHAYRYWLEIRGSHANIVVLYRNIHGEVSGCCELRTQPITKWMPYL